MSPPPLSRSVMGIAETFLLFTRNSSLDPVFFLPAGVSPSLCFPNTINTVSHQPVSLLYLDPSDLGLSICGTTPLSDLSVEPLVGPVLPNVIKVAIKVHKMLVGSALQQCSHHLP